MKRPPGAEMLDRARRLRGDSTEVEKLLWSRLRSRQLGVKFRRQMWLCGYIADFASAEAKLVVELDGGQHDRVRQKDERRSAVMAREGYEVIRFWNNDVFENLDGVLEMICAALARRIPSPSHPAAPRGPVPLPETGEGGDAPVLTPLPIGEREGPKAVRLGRVRVR